MYHVLNFVLRNAFLVLILLSPTISYGFGPQFEEYAGNPVIQTGPTGFDTFMIGNPQILVVDGVYYLYYSGAESNAIQVGLATSLDGITWTKSPNNPVFRCAENTASCGTTNSWSAYRVVPEAVIYQDGIFKMWYFGNSQNLTNVHRFGYATSTDGFQWGAFLGNPIFPINFEPPVQLNGLVYHNNLFYLYYRTSDEAEETHVATSTDGITWGDHSQSFIVPHHIDSVHNLGGRIIAHSDSYFGASMDGFNFVWNNTDSGYPDPSAQSTFLLEGDSLRAWYVKGTGRTPYETAIYYTTGPSEILPSIELPYATSSIAFIPGIMGSRLYRPDGEGGEDKLWESVKWKDVEELEMNTNGTSIRADIYTRDVVDVIRPLTGWWDYAEGYEGWIDFLDGLVVEGALPAWEAIPYDWRYATNDSAQMYPDVIATLEELAESSPSGKVTIVAHSNGGLVTKNVLKYLEDTNHPLLAKIDTVVLVASPQLGTPKAVGELLHGTLQPVQKTVREITEHMPGALGLLPSEAFFSASTEPIIEFDTRVSSVPGYASVAGTSIDSFDGLRNFLTGATPARGEPAENDLATPNTFVPALLDDASDMHADVDGWSAPEGMRVIELVGTGLTTPRGIHYSDCAREHCPATNANFLSHEWRMSSEGDGTVLARSGDGGEADETYYLAMDLANRNGVRNDAHGTILSVPALQTFVRNNVLDSETQLPLYMGEQLSNASNFPRFEMRAYSPIDLHLYSDSRHTGVTDEEETEHGRHYDKELVNSYYEEWGGVKYIGADFSMGDIELVIDGTDTGIFTLVFDVYDGDELTDTYTWTDIPVQAMSRGTMTLREGEVPVLHYDYDGDGRVDAELEPGDTLEPYPTGFAGLRRAIDDAGFPGKLESWLLARVDLAETLYAKGVKGTTAAAGEMLKTLLGVLGKNSGLVSGEHLTRIQSIATAILAGL